MAGIVDKRLNIEDDLFRKQTFCEDQSTSFTNQIAGMQTKLSGMRTALAEATEEQTQAETGSHTQAQAFDVATGEFGRAAQECCANQNEIQGQICALSKVRNELNQMAGDGVFIADCEVSEWRAGECSANCGKGITKSKRGVVTHPVGLGMKCPPLEKEETCNDIPCPIDCQVGEWSSWSECSAECGGGVRARGRSVLVGARHGGEPCSETEEVQGCGMGACNADCKLSDWGEWTACSKACGGGSRTRVKGVEEPGKGTGKCFEAGTDHRFEALACNPNTCSDMLKNLNALKGSRTVLNCASEVDVTILFDGSGSLEPYSWQRSKELVASLATQLTATGSARVAISLFSGPDDYPAYQACTQNTSSVDLDKTCNVKWVSHYSNDTVKLVREVMNVAWPMGSTLTSVALGLAQSELSYGRPTASSVVIVITDGKPMSERNTMQATKRLQEKAKLVWVPIGKFAPFDLVHKLAARPKSDYVVEVRGGFTSLSVPAAFDKLVNQIVATTCPAVS